MAEGSSSAVDKRALRYFAGRIALYARYAETPAQREKRDQMWLAEKKRLWLPLYRLVDFMLLFEGRMIEAFVFGCRIMSGIYGALTVTLIYLYIMTAIRILATGECDRFTYEQRYEHLHTCPAVERGYGCSGVLDAWVYASGDHFWRNYMRFAHDRHEVLGCWKV